MVVGNLLLMRREAVELGSLATQREELAAGGRAAVLVAIDAQGAGQFGIADAFRDTSPPEVPALRDAGGEVVMLTGDNGASARRITEMLGMDTVISEVPRGDKATKVAELRRGGRNFALVGDGDAVMLQRLGLPGASEVIARTILGDSTPVESP